MSKKRNDKKSTICMTLKPGQNFFVNHIQRKEKYFTEKELIKENGRVEDGTKNEKKASTTSLGENEPESNDNEGVTVHSPGHLFLWGEGALKLYRGCHQHILSIANNAKNECVYIYIYIGSK